MLTGKSLTDIQKVDFALTSSEIRYDTVECQSNFQVIRYTITDFFKDLLVLKIKNERFL